VEYFCVNHREASVDILYLQGVLRRGALMRPNAPVTTEHRGSWSNNAWIIVKH